MKVLFKIREFAWVIVSEIEDWLYPYRNRLTPEEQFEIRVKDPMSGWGELYGRRTHTISE